MPTIDLAFDDTVELAEMLRFINGWLTNNPDRLDASLRDYVGHPAHHIASLQADLARFTFLLRDDPDRELFQPPPPNDRHTPRST
jgi:hypothetical protein